MKLGISQSTPKAITDNISYVIAQLYSQSKFKDHDAPLFDDKTCLYTALYFAKRNYDPKKQVAGIYEQIKAALDELKNLSDSYAILNKIANLLESPLVPIQFKIHIRNKILDVIEKAQAKIKGLPAQDDFLRQKLYARMQDLKIGLLVGLENAYGRESFYNKPRTMFAQVKNVLAKFDILLEGKQATKNNPPDICAYFSSRYKELLNAIHKVVQHHCNKAPKTFLSFFEDKSNGLIAMIQTEFNYVTDMGNSIKKPPTENSGESPEKKVENAADGSIHIDLQQSTPEQSTDVEFDDFRKKQEPELVNAAEELAQAELQLLINTSPISAMLKLSKKIIIAEQTLKETEDDSERESDPESIQISQDPLNCNATTDKRAEIKKWESDLNFKLQNLRKELAKAGEKYNSSYLGYFEKKARKIHDNDLDIYERLKAIIEVNNFFALSSKQKQPWSRNQQFDQVLERINWKLREQNKLSPPRNRGFKPNVEAKTESKSEIYETKQTANKPRKTTKAAPLKVLFTPLPMPDHNNRPVGAEISAVTPQENPKSVLSVSRPSLR